MNLLLNIRAKYCFIRANGIYDNYQQKGVGCMDGYTVKYTTSFKKDYKRAIKRGLKIELLEQVVALLTLARTGIHSDLFGK